MRLTFRTTDRSHIVAYSSRDDEDWKSTSDVIVFECGLSGLVDDFRTSKKADSKCKSCMKGKIGDGI